MCTIQVYFGYRCLVQFYVLGILKYVRASVRSRSASAITPSQKTSVICCCVVIVEACSNLVDKVSSLLGIERQSLDQALLYRRISASHSRRRSVFHKPCTYSESISRRDCVAKLLYDRLVLYEFTSYIQCST